MCQTVIINDGEVEITTPAEFEAHFKVPPVRHRAYKTMDPNGCLCQCDLDTTFGLLHVNYTKDCMEYHVRKTNKK